MVFPPLGDQHIDVSLSGHLVAYLTTAQTRWTQAVLLLQPPEQLG